MGEEGLRLVFTVAANQHARLWVESNFQILFYKQSHSRTHSAAFKKT